MTTKKKEWITKMDVTKAPMTGIEFDEKYPEDKYSHYLTAFRWTLKVTTEINDILNK